MERGIVPIRKKGGRKGEGLQGRHNNAVSVYATVVAGRLEKEVEEEKKVSQNQTEFRKEIGTIDNVYVLNYLVNRQLSKERGKLVAFFV